MFPVLVVRVCAYDGGGGTRPRFASFGAQGLRKLLSGGMAEENGFSVGFFLLLFGSGIPAASPERDARNRQCQTLPLPPLRVPRAKTNEMKEDDDEESGFTWALASASNRRVACRA